MDFARFWEQAQDLWAKPVGKVIFITMGLLVAGVAAVSFTLTRPVVATLGTFSAEDAPKVAAKLNESRIPYTQTGATGFTFQVSEPQLNAARLVLAEIDLDPVTSIWSQDLWKNRVSWSNTDFDKRALRIEQIESNLQRTIMTLSVVERARVQISVPMEQRLFPRDEQPPKAVVTLLPRRGQKLTTPITEGIMELVASAVEGLQPTSVVVMDASTSRIASAEAFLKNDAGQTATELSSDLFAIRQKVQETVETSLTRQLERVVGPGNVSVIVTPVINWEKLSTEAVTYKGGAPDGKGIVLSQQTEKSSSEGTSGAAGQAPAGTVSNSELLTPTYPSVPPQTDGTASSETNNQIINYLVDQIRTTSEKPGGVIDEVSVGILVNSARVDAAAEQQLHSAVAVAMGRSAQVEVVAVPFADDLLKILDDARPPGPPAAPTWLYWILGVALGLGGIGFFLVATRPRRPVLEPVFAGPEAAMMGGIPVTEAEMPPLRDPLEKRLPETAEELAQLSPDELATLSDDYLIKLGVDPSKVRMKERVEKVAKVQPDLVANLLRTWMSEE